MQVSEIFYSIQGEGPNAGKPMVFLRLAGCNLRCDFCDSKYAWCTKKNMYVEEIIEEIQKYDCRRLCITGGEPLLQQEGLWRLFRIMQESRWYIEVETNGTIYPDSEIKKLVDLWIVSPKLSGSHVSEKKRINVDVLWNFKEINSVFKFVITSMEDIEEVIALEDKFHLCKDVIYLMPEGITCEEITCKSGMIIEACKKYGYNYSPRLQIMIYGNQRGI